MIRATEVGAAPHMTRMVFSMVVEDVEVKVDYLPEPTSKMNILDHNFAVSIAYLRRFIEP